MTARRYIDEVLEPHVVHTICREYGSRIHSVAG
jgi:hypothetical protein